MFIISDLLLKDKIITQGLKDISKQFLDSASLKISYSESSCILTRLIMCINDCKNIKLKHNVLSEKLHVNTCQAAGLSSFPCCAMVKMAGIPLHGG